MARWYVCPVCWLQLQTPGFWVTSIVKFLALSTVLVALCLFGVWPPSAWIVMWLLTTRFAIETPWNFIIVWSPSLFFWLIGILTFSAPLFSEDNYYIYQQNIVLCGMYWKSPIFCVVTGLYTPILSAVILFWTSYKVTKTLKNISKVKASRGGQVRTGRDAKAVRMLVISGISYFAAWGPYTIAVYLVAFKAIPSIVEPLEFTVAWLANSNSFMNVLIYSGSFEGFRKRLKSYFSCCCVIKCCRQNSVEPVSLQEDSVPPSTITQANVY